MAQTKYELYFQEMLEQNRELFDEFISVHNEYVQDPEKWQQRFNEVGGIVQDVIRKYENRLCARSGNTGYGKYTIALADKFQAVVKRFFPKINMIGLEVSR